MIHRLAAVALMSLASAAIAQDPPHGANFADYSARAMTRIMAADTDHDGRISKDEFTAAMKARGGKHRGARMFDRADSNHDGYLDRAELGALFARRFAKRDANHDGMLTPDERQARPGAAADPQQ